MQAQFQDVLPKVDLESEQSDQSDSDTPNDKSGLNSTLVVGGQKIRKKGTKQLYQKIGSKYYCRQAMCVNSKTDRFGFKDESSVKRHLRERHDYSFDKEVTKGESCFVCPPDHWGKKYHSTSLKIHLQKDHQIQTEGTNLKKLKKMYKKVTCFYCKGRIVLAEADQHMLTHGIKGKSFSEVEIKWNVFRKSRHTADQLNLNLQETFLSQLKGDYLKVKKTEQKKVDKLSYLINRASYDLEKHGHFLILAMKNIFDINNYWTKPVFYEKLLLALRLFYKQSSVIQNLKQPFQLEDLVQLEFESLIVEKMKFKKRKVDLATKSINSIRQLIVKPTLELYQHYFELMLHDGFIAYNKTLEDFVDSQKQRISSKMNEYTKGLKQERITQVRRVVSKPRIQTSSKPIIRGKMKKIQKKRNIISKMVQFEKVKRHLIYSKLDRMNREILEQRYWFKTPRQIRFFNKVVFRKEYWQSLADRKWDQEHGKIKQDETDNIVYRICERHEARTELLGRRPVNPIRIPTFYLYPSDSERIVSADVEQRVQREQTHDKGQLVGSMSQESSSSQEEAKMTIREERWLQINHRNCNIILFRRDPQYRRHVMAYPFPEFIRQYEQAKDTHQLLLSNIARNAEFRSQYEQKMNQRFQNLCKDNSRIPQPALMGHVNGKIVCPNLKCVALDDFCHDMCPKAVAWRQENGGRMGIYKQFVSSRRKTKFVE